MPIRDVFRRGLLQRVPIMRLIITTVTTLFATSALACAPAPSCWLEEGPAYVRSICRGYEKDHRTVADIRGFVDEPEQVPAFIAACKKQGVTFKEK